MWNSSSGVQDWWTVGDGGSISGEVDCNLARYRRSYVTVVEEVKKAEVIKLLIGCSMLVC